MGAATGERAREETEEVKEERETAVFRGREGEEGTARVATREETMAMAEVEEKGARQTRQSKSHRVRGTPSSDRCKRARV